MPKPLFLSLALALAVPFRVGADDQCMPDSSWTITARTPRAVIPSDCTDSNFSPSLVGVCTTCGGEEVCQVWAFEFSSPTRTQNHAGVLVRNQPGGIISVNPSATLSDPCVSIQSLELGSNVCHQTLVRWNQQASKVIGKVVTRERGSEETTAAVRDGKTTLSCALEGPGVEGDPFEATADAQAGFAGECPYIATLRGNRIVSVVVDTENVPPGVDCAATTVNQADFQISVNGTSQPLSFVAPTDTKNPFTTGTGTCYWFGPTKTGQYIGIGNPTCP